MNSTIFTPKTRPTGQGFAFSELWRWAQGLLPEGQVLPDLVWRQRHRWLVGLLLLHATGLPVMGLLAGHTVGWSAAAGLILASLAGMASWGRISRVTRAALVTTGLITAGMILVHFSNGRIEAHFHFFIIMAFIAIYQEWFPFLLALGLIVLHHGTMGTLMPTAVYNHPHAMAHPWVWAAIHGGSILAESFGLLLYWKFNETATAQVRKSERQFQLVVESAPHGLLMVNQAGVMIMVNSQIERIGGYQRQELLGQPMEILIPERFKPDLRRAHDHACSTHVMESDCNLSVRRKDGTECPVQLRLNALEMPDGLHLLASIMDITARRQQEAAVRLAKFSMDQAADAIYWIDSHANILDVNDAAGLMLGYSKDELCAMTVHDLNPDFQADRWPEFWADTQRRGTIMIKTSHRTKDGRRIPIEVNVNYLTYEGNEYHCVFARDITTRMQVESKLRQVTIEMECKNLELELANDLAQTATEAKSRFLASMSHEIRTPMNAIVGMAELLAETTLTKEQEDYVNRFSRAATHLLELINDVLDFSKIEADQLELETVDFNLPELVESAAELMANHAHAKRLEFMTDIHMNVPETVIGDPTRLRQILVNLISNAIKFTERGEIVIRVESAGPSLVRFEISDTGIGIPENKVRSIFETFTQVDSSTTRKYGGTGLGLSISKRLTELMGGEIEVNSLLGLGSTFGFTIMLPAATAATTGPYAAFPTLQGLRLLVVDDHETNRSVIEAVLSKSGAFVTAYENGPDALALMRQASATGEPVQLAIVDRLMPSMDGFQVVEAMRQTTELAGIPVLMLTSGMRKEDSESAQRLGIQGTLSKPIGRAALLIAAAAAIASHATEAGPSLLPTAPLPSTAEPTRRLRILLAEDLEDNRAVVALFLNKTPWTLEFAEDGAAAVAKFQAGQYDLVLMDMQMPVLDGYQATAAMRRWEQEHQRAPTPIVALTANAFAKDLNESLASGCTAYLTKPIKKQVLLKAIREHTQQPMDHAA